MNKARRRRLNEANILLLRTLNIIENIKDDEETTFYNMPENLQGSERGYNMENNVEVLEETIDYLNDALYNVEQVI